MSSQIFSEIPKTGEWQEKYWNGAMTRSECQKVFDDFAQALVKVKEHIIKMDFAVSYLIEKFNIQPAEVQEFMARKLKEYEELQKTAAEAAKS